MNVHANNDENINSSTDPEDSTEDASQVQSDERTQLRSKSRFIFLKIIFLIIVLFLLGGYWIDPYGYLGQENLVEVVVVVFFLAWFVVTIGWIVFLCVKRKIGLISCIFFSLICLIISNATICNPLYLRPRKPPWENRCKLSLRALGSSELSYFESTISGVYADFDELKEVGFIQPDFTRGTLIDNYSLVVFDVKPATLNKAGFPNDDSTFVIIAVPTAQKRKIRTYAICDDQTVRVWIGDTSRWNERISSIKDETLWEPIK